MTEFFFPFFFVVGAAFASGLGVSARSVDVFSRSLTIEARCFAVPARDFAVWLRDLADFAPPFDVDRRFLWIFVLDESAAAILHR